MTSRSNGIFAGVDWITILIYTLIMTIGCLLITSSSFAESGESVLSLSHFYMKQAVWCGIALVVGLFVLLIDDHIYHKFAMPFYVIGLLMLVATLVIGTEVNGAKAWISIGSFRLQPVEFVKIATALAVSRTMSRYTFNINSFDDLIKVCMLLAVPLMIIVLQNDTGSGIVLGSFLFVFYREGLNKWLCTPIILVAALFIFSFLLTPLTLLLSILLICVVSEMMLNGMWRSRLIYLASVLLASILLYIIINLIAPGAITLYNSMLWTSVASLPIVAVYAYRANLGSLFLMIGLFVGTVLFLPATNYIFSSVLKEHQQKRILSFLGIVSDPLGIDYNVNQSKIAIGSGGFLGKGFLQGTQIKYGFVPEKHTDFIFCAAGEEWGFIGALVLLGLMCTLIMRLISMGERQEETFGRVYCYCVAAILLFHTFVNVGMTVGLMPVMGIPLPFVSYGGSSLVAFTILLFIAIRLDASTRKGLSRSQF